MREKTKTFYDELDKEYFLEAVNAGRHIEIHLYEDHWTTVYLTRNTVKNLIEHLQGLVEDED